jgi:hypothetical protein
MKSWLEMKEATLLPGSVMIEKANLAHLMRMATYCVHFILGNYMEREHQHLLQIPTRSPVNAPLSDTALVRVALTS